MKATIHIGDCRDVLAGMPADTFHAVVCDPPYELNFMGREWDRRGIAFDPAFWREALRVLRPGGHLVAFGGTRTHHRMFCAIEDAGFEIRDCLAYMFGSGFPKSKNLTDEWQGWGTALKPAYEPICLARKPLSESSVAKNVLRWGTGALNIDGCRIGFSSEEDRLSAFPGGATTTLGGGHVSAGAAHQTDRQMFETQRSESGRWPANLLLDEEAAAMLDEQSGERTSGKPCGLRGASTGKGLGYGSTSTADTALTGYGDTGGASRFFFTAKPSVSEREDGLAHVTPRTRNRVNSGGLENDPKWAPTTRRNTHPTVKPFDLMSWLVRLVTPPGGIVCDPFLGSGSTGMAAVAEGFDFVGIEQDERFAEIAEGRIRNVAPLLVATEIHGLATEATP